MVSAFVAFILRRAPSGASITSLIAKLAGVVVLGGALLLSVGAAEDFFGLDEFSTEGVSAVLDDTRARTAQGGSQPTSEDRTDQDLSSFPTALVRVLFRPFPWEADNVQGGVAALEGAALLVLFATSWRRPLVALRSALRRPYVLLCCIYAVTFTYGFSSFANFGILTRQRV